MYCILLISILRLCQIGTEKNMKVNGLRNISFEKAMSRQCKPDSRLCVCCSGSSSPNPNPSSKKVSEEAVGAVIGQRACVSPYAGGDC